MDVAGVIALMNSRQLWLPTQNLHMIEPTTPVSSLASSVNWTQWVTEQQTQEDGEGPGERIGLR